VCGVAVILNSGLGNAVSRVLLPNSALGVLRMLLALLCHLARVLKVASVHVWMDAIHGGIPFIRKCVRPARSCWCAWKAYAWMDGCAKGCGAD